MASFFDIDFNLEFVSKALKEKQLDACRVRMAILRVPEKMKPIGRAAIDADDTAVFCFFVERGLPLLKNDNFAGSLWDELIQRDKIHLIESVLNMNKRVLPMEELTNLKKALSTNRPSFTKGRENFIRFKALSQKIDALQSKMMASSCFGLNMCRVRDMPKGDFPPVMIATFGHQSYCFDGLQRKKIQAKGFSGYLIECLDNHTAMLQANARPNSEKDKWLSDYFDNKPDIGAEPFSQQDAIEFQRIVDEDKTVFYKNEFDKADAFYETYKAFCESPNAPLARLFEKQHKTFVLFKDAGQSVRGQRLDEFVVLANISDSTLHHELIHNVDEDSALSSSPFFKKMYTYAQKKMQEEVIASMFGRDSFWATMHRCSQKYESQFFSREMLPFFATILKEKPHLSVPAFIKPALQVVNAYAAACLYADVSEKKRILKALEQDDMPLTVKAFDAHLRKILAPIKRRQKECLTRAIVLQNQYS